jgi:hypothetical protein
MNLGMTPLIMQKRPPGQTSILSFKCCSHGANLANRRADANRKWNHAATRGNLPAFQPAFSSPHFQFALGWRHGYEDESENGRWGRGAVAGSQPMADAMMDRCNIKV